MTPYSDSADTSGLWHMDTISDDIYIDDDNSAGNRDNAYIILNPNPASIDGPTLIDPNTYPAGNSAFANCLSFDGIDDGGAIPNSLLSFDPDNVRIEFWFKADAASDGQVLLDRWGQMVLYLHSDNLSIQAWDGQGTVAYYDNGFDPNDANSIEWTHFAVEVLDGRMEVYLNGGLVGSHVLSGGLAAAPTRDNTYIAQKYNNRNYFAGCMDEIRISKAELPDCGDWGYLDGDINRDCAVDVNDLLLLASEWFDNTDPANANARQGSFEDYTSYNIPMAADEPNIDGTLLPGEWDDAKVIPIVYPDIVTAPNVGSQKYEEPSPADLSAYYYFKWDIDYLYVGIKVYDEDMVFGEGYPGDHAALGINLNRTATEMSDAAFYVMYINSEGDPNIVNDPWYNQAFNPGNAVKAASSQADGWSFEVAYKWSDLNGYIPTVGDQHGFVAFLCDNDDNDGIRDTFLYDSGSGDTSVNANPSAYRVVTLTDGIACGDLGFIETDIDGNCIVNLADLAEMAKDWLGCTDPAGIGCVDLR